MQSMRFFVALGLWGCVFLASGVTALAQEPEVITATITGVMDDQDPLTGEAVTRSITLTVVFTPATTYPITLTTTGNRTAWHRSITYGDVVSGAPALALVFIAIFYIILKVARRQV